MKILCVSPDNKALGPDRANTYKEAVARYKLVQRIPSSEEVDWGVLRVWSGSRSVRIELGWSSRHLVSKKCKSFPDLG